MDDYAMGLFLAARRKILSVGSDVPVYLCMALSDVLYEDGGDYIRNKEILELFPSFAAAYDRKHFRLGNLIDVDSESDAGISGCWWYPAVDKNPRIAMIDFLVGK